MARTEDIDAKTVPLHVVVYGASGTGKTRFASTFPKPYFFDCDNGMLSLMGVKGIEYDTFKDMSRNGINIKSGWQDIQDKLREQEEKNWPYDTYVFDSMTTIILIASYHFARLNRHTIPQYEDMGKTSGQIKDFIFRVNNIPKNVVIIAHEEIEKNELDGTLSFLPSLLGKQLAGLFEDLPAEVYRSTVRGEGSKLKYLLLTQKATYYHAKSRLDCLSPEETPDYKVIIEKVQKKGVAVSS